MSANTVTIYHNPRCSKSRKTLELLREQGIEPEIVAYLDVPPTEADLRQILSALQMSARQIMRTGEAEYKDNALADTTLTDDQLIAAIARFPKVMQRPIVICGDQAVIGRPPENALELISS